MELDKDFSEFVESFIEHDVRFMIVGGYALAAHGLPRATGFGYPPYRIDILTSIDGVEFEEAWDRRLTVELQGLSVPVIGRDDLIVNKRAAGCRQDLADVERLTKFPNEGPHAHG